MTAPVLAENTTIRSVAAIGLDAPPRSWPDAPVTVEQWDRLVRRAKRERIVGLLAHAVELGVLPTTPEQLEITRVAQTADLHTCLLLEEHLLSVSGTLETAGVDVRVLKGAAVAHLDYDDPSRRSFRDADLLVRSERFDQAVQALTAAGCHRRYREVRPGFDRRFGKGSCLVSPLGLETDLHRTFVMGPYGLWIDLDELWTAAVPLQLGGRGLLALPADLRFLHACYHAALGDARPRLAQLRDVAQLLVGREAAVDVDRARSLAAAWRGEAVVARAVSLAWEALDLPPNPTADWARAHHRDRIDDWAMATYLDPGMGFAARSVMAVGAIPGWRAKASFIRSMAVPSRTYGAGLHRTRGHRMRVAAGEIWRLIRRQA